MSLYDIALFVHIMGVIAMFGGFVLYARAGARLRAASDMQQVRSWLGLLETTGPMFAGGTVMMLASGIYMMASRWRGPHPWLIVPLAGLLTIWVLGARTSARHHKAIRGALGNSRESISGELALRIADPFPWTVIAMLNGLAVGIVFVMSTKPGWVGSVAAAAVGAGIGFVAGATVVRGRHAAPGELGRAES